MNTNFKSIFELLESFPDEQTCIDHLETLRWGGNVVSPFDPESQVYKCSNNRYKCKNTGKYFNVKTQTVFEDTKIPLRKWFMALYIFTSHKKGISSHQLAKDINTTQKTAWFMLHRLRYAFNHPDFQRVLSGEVEADETYIGGKAENKHVDKKKEGTQGRNTDDKSAVFGLYERKGNVIAQKVENVKKKTLQPIIKEKVEPNSLLSTMAHTNNLECFWSHLKRGIDGIYHWISKKHLQSYVTEFSLRFDTRDNLTCDRFDLILSNVAGRLTYKQLIGYS